MEQENLARVRSVLLDRHLALSQKGAILLQYLYSCGIGDRATNAEVRKVLQNVIDSASDPKQRSVLVTILDAMLTDALPLRQLQ
jgi:hypothetical protein